MARDNGPLYVVPGSHRRGYIQHIDTPSHLGLPEDQFSFDKALPIDGEKGSVPRGKQTRPLVYPDASSSLSSLHIFCPR